MTPQMNRSAIARDRAGLSLGQAARLFNITVDELAEIEEADKLTDILEESGVVILAATFGVSVEWVTGVVPQYDYASVDKMIICGRGHDGVSPRDREVLAEFAASLPRETRTARQRLDDVRKKKA